MAGPEPPVAPHDVDLRTEPDEHLAVLGAVLALFVPTAARTAQREQAATEADRLVGATE